LTSLKHDRYILKRPVYITIEEDKNTVIAFLPDIESFACGDTENEIDRIFKKLNLQIRHTGHNYGWLIVKGKKILRVHFSHGKGDIPAKISSKIRGQLKIKGFFQNKKYSPKFYFLNMMTL